ATNNTRSCLACHQNISEMRLSNSDNDAGTFDADNDGVNGTNISAYHYGRKRADMRSGVNTSCTYCHQNSSSVFPMSDTNKSIYEHTNNSTANIANAALTCTGSKCHSQGFIHNSTLAKPTIQVWTPGSKDNCAPCHKVNDANATKYVYSHNTTQTPINEDCGYCHNASSQGINGSTIKIHTSTLTNRTTAANSTTCQGCHNGTAVYTGAAKQIFSHIPNASQYRGNTTTSGYTCEACHNMSNKPSMHSPGMNLSNGTCETCHFNNTSPFKSLAKNITQSAGMPSHSYNGSANTTCKMCHNASGRAKFHISKYAYGDIAEPQDSFGNPTFSGYDTWPSDDSNNRGILVDCRDCHEKYNDTAPFNAPFFEANKTGINAQEHVGKGYKLQNCYFCHTYEDNVSKPVTVHNVSIEPISGGANCTKCHDISSTDSDKAPSTMLVNFTAFNSTGVNHRNLTNATAWGGSTAFGLIDTACWACHQSDGKQMERHPDLKDDTSLTGGSMAYRCADCHTVGGNASSKQPSIYNKAKKIYKHYPGAVFIGSKVFINAVNCSMCHKNSKISDINLSAYSAYIDAMATNVSHYATRTDLIDTRNSTESRGCTKCHASGQSGSYYGNAKIMYDTHNTKGGSPQRCQISCHNSNPGVNITLHAQEMGVNIGTSTCYGSGCHAAPIVVVPRRR
ncbi:MAG: CxxxxCH/CxxCH domain-containing protein, partial [Candidatus Methanoperedens sp.]|nr:CxxxxCH/CxxCH domain-containing protein [Candidatus Methanoperedens sp.]